VTSAVLLAAAGRRPARGAIFHSDRGSEYMGAPFAATVARLGMLQSANVSGPGDNAHAESFFHSLKAELTRGGHLSYRARAPLGPHPLPALLQHPPPALWHRLPLTSCLRTARRVITWVSTRLGQDPKGMTEWRLRRQIMRRPCS
jgi:transposase InsO family protein